MAKKSPEPATTTIVDHGEMLRRKLAERRARLDTATTAATEKLDAYGLVAARAHIGQATDADVAAARDALSAERNSVEEMTAEIAGLERLLAEHEREVEAKRRAAAHARATELAAVIAEHLASSESQMRAAVREWCAAQDAIRQAVPLLESIGGTGAFGAYLTRAPGAGIGPAFDSELQWVSAFAWLISQASGGRLPPPASLPPPEWAIPAAFAERVSSFFAAALEQTQPNLSPNTQERDAA